MACSRNRSAGSWRSSISGWRTSCETRPRRPQGSEPCPRALRGFGQRRGLVETLTAFLSVDATKAATTSATSSSSGSTPSASRSGGGSSRPVRRFPSPRSARPARPSRHRPAVPAGWRRANWATTGRRATARGITTPTGRCRCRRMSGPTGRRSTARSSTRSMTRRIRPAMKRPRPGLSWWGRGSTLRRSAGSCSPTRGRPVRSFNGAS